MTKRAFIVVDVQNDFCEGGALAVKGGNAVANGIKEYMTDHAHRFDHVIFSQDWHRSFEDDPTGNCGHFAIPPASPDFSDTWPVHCVEGTKGSALHKDVKDLPFALKNTIEVRKGQGVPAYSALEGTLASFKTGNNSYPLSDCWGATLETILTYLEIEVVVVAGLAFDHCVKATALDAAKANFKVTVLKDLTASVSPDNDETNVQILTDNGVEVVS